jgi:ketosteroid isomerase-like protein
MDRLFSLLADDVVFDTRHLGDWPETEYVGHVGLKRFLSEWLEVWVEFEVGVDEHIQAPDGRVAVLYWQRGKGRHSGLTMDVKWAAIGTFRDGLAIRIEMYESRAEALKVAGLA